MADIRMENEVMFEEQDIGTSIEVAEENYSFEGKDESGSGLLGKVLLVGGAFITGIVVDKVANKVVPAVKEFKEARKEKSEEKKELKAEKKAKKKSKNKTEEAEEATE